MKDSEFEQLELALLRKMVDKVEKISGKKTINTPAVKKMIKIVENFIKTKKLICYGGTAINNILPAKDQFYDKDVEIPDYDFFSSNALAHAKELADIYLSRGFDKVEAKSGMHKGTYKVFVNFIPVADITQLDGEIYRNIKREAIKKNGILYTPANFLRMSMYLELSRPHGDVSRWEKILKRLILLNRHYPLAGYSCDEKTFQRSMEDVNNYDVYGLLKNTFIKEKVVFFGGYANTIYARYMPAKEKRRLSKNPDFDVLSEDPEGTAEKIMGVLLDGGYEGAQIVKHDGIGELIEDHYEIKIGQDTVAFIYEPNACHSYNVIRSSNKGIKIATIDTMLSFYLAFLYSDREYYDDDRILCMANYLFKVQSKNRLKQKGVLKRFSINCYGKQKGIPEIRSKKSEMYEKLRRNRKSKQYEEWFLNYSPGSQKKKKTKRRNPLSKNRRTRRKRK